MHRRRFSLRGQFILLIIVGLSVMFVMVAIVVTRVTSNNLRNSLVSESKSFASLATKPIGDTFVTYQDSGRLRIIQQVQKFTDLDNNISNVSVVDVAGKTLYTQNDKINVQVSQEHASSFDPVYIMDGNKLTRIITPYIEDTGAHRFSMVYDVSYAEIDKSINALQAGIVALAFVALLTSIVIAYLLISRLFLSPLSEVSTSALAISKGNLNLKIEPQHNDEIGDVAMSVNTMAEALKADIRKLKEVDAIKTEFMMIASHNLRTPLTIIQGYLDNLLVTQELTPDVRKTVEVVAASGNRLSVFAEDILTVSRLEAGENIMEQRNDTDVVKLLNTIAKDFEPLVKEKNLEFSTQIEAKSCKARISTPHFRAAIWNLLDNALKFTEKGNITLSLKTVGGKAVIGVRDTGLGIAPDEVPKLFTKFHRGTSTLTYNYEGTGIGLYLTKLIIEQHGGTVAVDSKLGSGTEFVVAIPLSSSGQDS